MSSEYVRTQVKAFVTAGAPSETLVDLTAAFDELRDFLGEADVQPDAPWLGIQFVGNNEEPVGLAATNVQGLYRETGTIQIHVVAAAALGVANGLLSRGTALRNLFRGQRIGSIQVLSVTPMNFDHGATLEFQGGYTSGTFTVAYRNDVAL